MIRPIFCRVQHCAVYIGAQYTSGRSIHRGAVYIGDRRVRQASLYTLFNCVEKSIVPMRRDADFFEDREMDLIYIAKKLQEALRLESALTESGVDYAVETDNYTGGVIFRSERVGAFFYVLPEAADQARRIMRQHGFRFLT